MRRAGGKSGDTHWTGKRQDGTAYSAACDIYAGAKDVREKLADLGMTEEAQR